MGRSTLYHVLLALLLFSAGCAPLPDEDIVLADVKQQKIKDFTARQAVVRTVESARIRRLKKLFGPSGAERAEAQGYFQRRDFDAELRAYTDQIESMSIVSLKRSGDRLTGVAEYQNNYGSRFQVKFGYTRSASRWIFTKSAEEDTVLLSPDEKKEYLRVKVRLAIDQFADRTGRFPESLQELTPGYIDAIPPLEWRYDPQTGELQVS